jgi:hypothetical protein
MWGYEREEYERMVIERRYGYCEEKVNILICGCGFWGK